jgi:hypothetical protein
MKNLFPAIFLLALTACNSGPKPCEKIEDEKAREVIVDYFRAITEKDYEGLVNLSSEDYKLFEDGMVWNNDSLINNIKGMPDARIDYEFRNFSYDADCNGSFVHYLNHGRLTLNDTVQIDLHWVESAYVKREDGRLKLGFLHSSVAK